MSARRRLVPAVLAAALCVTAGCANQQDDKTADATPVTVDATPSATPDADLVYDDKDCHAGILTLVPTAEKVDGEYGEQTRVRIVLTNKGTAPCRLQGTPDLQLIGPTDPDFGPVYTLPHYRTGTDAFMLAPRESAHLTIQYLTGDWTPARISLTLPNTNIDTSDIVATAWPAGPILRQDAATHPGTWFGPFMPGAEGPLAPDVT